MNRDYINWLETLPCNRNTQKVNAWMGGWAPLPENVDLPCYEAWQNRGISGHIGLMRRLRGWLSSR